MKGNSERITAEGANEAFELHAALEERFRSDGIVDLAERRILKLARRVCDLTDFADATVGLLLCGFHRQGVRSATFRRRLRALEQRDGPEPEAA